jgi:hypothetical protein
MAKIIKKKVVVSESVGSKSTPSVSAESLAVPASAPAAAVTDKVVAPAPAVVTTMTDPAVQECGALLNQIVALLGDQEPLSADQVRRSTKMRKGGSEVIPKILALCLQHGVTKIGSLTIEEMSDQLKRGDALVQVGLRSALVQKKVRESAMGAHGRSWQIGTTMYTTLRRLAVDDPELAQGLESIQSFFQTKKTKGLVRVNKKAREAKKQAKEAAATAKPTTAAESVTASPVVSLPVVATAAPVTSGNGAAGSAVNGTATAAATPVAVTGAN